MGHLHNPLHYPRYAKQASRTQIQQHKPHGGAGARYNTRKGTYKHKVVLLGVAKAEYRPGWPLAFRLAKETGFLALLWIRHLRLCSPTASDATLSVFPVAIAVWITDQPRKSRLFRVSSYHEVRGS
jgi:hypothetical protein